MTAIDDSEPARYDNFGQIIEYEAVSLLDEARRSMYEQVLTDEASVAYYNSIKFLDLVVTRCIPDGVNSFWFASDLDPQEEGAALARAQPCGVLECFDMDGETVNDLVAWPIDSPKAYIRAFGVGLGLGLSNVMNPAIFHGGRPIRVYKTPEGWAKAGGRGVCILESEYTAQWLSKSLGRILCEDVDHARAVARLLKGTFDLRKIGFVARPKQAGAR